MKSKAPPSALPFANTMGDSLELMKKMWGMAGLPGIPNAGNLASMAMRLPQQLPQMVAPTFDVNELDKRIADLRAVEQWLELNAGMLRTAIQTLEVQRATIATLKGISGAMLAPLTKPGEKPAAGAVPPDFGVPPPDAMAAVGAAAARKTAPRKRPKAKPAPHPPTVADAPLNPTAWWNTLQDQFTKIAASAVVTPPPKKAAGKPSRPRAAKAPKSG
jgi:hypothetical protein